MVTVFCFLFPNGNLPLIIVTVAQDKNRERFGGQKQEWKISCSMYDIYFGKKSRQCELDHSALQVHGAQVASSGFQGHWQNRSGIPQKKLPCFLSLCPVLNV